MAVGVHRQSSLEAGGHRLLREVEGPRPAHREPLEDEEQGGLAADGHVLANGRFPVALNAPLCGRERPLAPEPLCQRPRAVLVEAVHEVQRGDVRVHGVRRDATERQHVVAEVNPAQDLHGPQR
eukprot:10086095-Lingulodinium_polyedra.AAC.1